MGSCGLVARLGNSDRVEDGRDLRLLWELAPRRPLVRPLRAAEIENPRMQQRVDRRENSFRDTVLCTVKCQSEEHAPTRALHF